MEFLSWDASERRGFCDGWFDLGGYATFSVHLLQSLKIVTHQLPSEGAMKSNREKMSILTHQSPIMFFRRDAYSPHPHLFSWPYPAFSGGDESGGPRHPVSFKRRE
jgi:hypothetical protein